MTLILAGTTLSLMSAQQSSTSSLVFDGVAVVDVEQEKLVPGQRVVITGNHIEAVGAADAVKAPKGAQIVDARGKYLIPGLWDLHVHPRRKAHIFYPLFIANGVTGIRDAGSEVPADTLLLWRQEIAAGTRVGPPRQILSIRSIAETRSCDRAAWQRQGKLQTCVGDTADARHLVDSLKAAGSDMIKPRAVKREMYFVIAAESRRLGVPFGGHAHAAGLTAQEASDSGARILDHGGIKGLVTPCWGQSASIEECQPVAEKFQRNDSWWAPSLAREGGRGAHARTVLAYFKKRIGEFWTGSVLSGNWLRDSASVQNIGSPIDSSRAMYVMQRVDLPIVAATDAGAPVLRSLPPGFSLHAELAMYVAEGLTPAAALQTATINPAKMFHVDDSLGAIVPGKLADLVLLDADPLTDITNTTTIHAVVANGRYYDRAALDSLLAEVQSKGP